MDWFHGVGETMRDDKELIYLFQNISALKKNNTISACFQFVQGVTIRAGGIAKGDECLPGFEF